MTMRGRALAIFSQSYRFHSCWRTLQRNNTGLLCGGFVNLKQEPQSFIQNVNSKCMSLANLPVPETNVQRFLKHLVKAYTDGDRTEFKSLLEHYAVKKLMDEKIQILENIKSLKELGQEDKEMKKLADEEKLVYDHRLQQIDDELINLVLESLEGDNFDDVILELTAGVGGQESMLFLKELLEMYKHHLIYLGYSFDIIEIDDSTQGGVRHASLSISGRDSFEKLRHEAGVHRVQRVPATEKSGRIHTSVVSVAVLPQPSEIQVEIKPKDLRIDTMRASGAGGQHVNTTNSAVRITHLPTGISVECQTDRSQIKNRKLALAKLRAKLYEIKLSAQLKNTTGMRKQQMGMGERHEKIRTYNYNQDRITDHRLSDGTLHNLENFLQGGPALDDLHTRLNQDLRYNMLLEVVSSVK